MRRLNMTQSAPKCFAEKAVQTKKFLGVNGLVSANVNPESYDLAGGPGDADQREESDAHSQDGPSIHIVEQEEPRQIQFNSSRNRQPARLQQSMTISG